MSRPEEDDAYNRFTRSDGQGSEVCVVRDDDTTLTVRSLEDVRVVTALKPFLGHGPDILASGAKTLDDAGVDVLVGEKREIQHPHAGASTSQPTSPLTARAA